jgi:predicted N-formylglutamate amidohydrolase
VSRDFALLVTCEHGGNRVPREHRALFAGREDLLETHHAYDPGALDTAKILARRFGASFFASTVTRLLVELNRSPSHPRLYSEVTRRLSLSLRERIRERYYVPHRASVEGAIVELQQGGGTVLHVASHSFTPNLEGEERRADVAWLYDPARTPERSLAAAWKDALGERRPELKLRRNYPYRGVDDGLTTHLRRLFPEDSYLGIELEVNQKWYLGETPERRRLRRDLVESLALALRRTSSE